MSDWGVKSSTLVAGCGVQPERRGGEEGSPSLKHRSDTMRRQQTCR